MRTSVRCGNSLGWRVNFACGLISSFRLELLGALGAAFGDL